MSKINCLIHKLNRLFLNLMAKHWFISLMKHLKLLPPLHFWVFLPLTAPKSLRGHYLICLNFIYSLRECKQQHYLYTTDITSIFFKETARASWKGYPGKGKITQFFECPMIPNDLFRMTKLKLILLVLHHKCMFSKIIFRKFETNTL